MQINTYGLKLIPVLLPFMVTLHTTGKKITNLAKKLHLTLMSEKVTEKLRQEEKKKLLRRQSCCS
jgi:hypothetical protein